MVRDGLAITPKNFVERAKDPSNSCHDLFDWDLESAAQKHWLASARIMLASIMTMEVKTGTPRRRLLNLVVDSKSAPRQYEFRERVLKSDDKRHQIGRRLFKTIEAAVTEAEGLKLPDDNPVWANVCQLVRAQLPYTEEEVEADVG
jgi:hypothetical protein